MRYIMRQRILSWGDDFSIKDADGQEVYYIDGKVFSFGNKLSILDRSGAELARINQKLLSIGPRYEIVRGGETVAVVKKHLFTPFRARFTVDVPGPDDLEAHGDFLDHEYVFERGERVVARVSKKWFVSQTPTLSTLTRGKMTCSFWRQRWSSTSCHIRIRRSPDR